MSDQNSEDGQEPLLWQPLKAQKGRGAASNMQGRYELLGRERFDDGWAVVNGEEDVDEPLVGKTQVFHEEAKSILA